MNKSLRDLREANDEQFKPKLPQIVEEAVLSEEDDFEASLLALNHLAVMADDLYSVMGGEEIKVTPDEIAAILSAYDLVSEIYDKYEQVVAMPSKEYDMDALDTEVMEEVEQELQSLDEAVELVEAVEVKKQKLSWGTVITIHKGSDFSVVMHPDDQKKVEKLKAGGSVSFKDETGITWNVKLLGSQYSFRSSEGGNQVSVNKSDLFESVQLDELTGDDNVLSHRVPAKELAVLDKLGFKEAKPGKDTWMSSQYKVKKMWGIPMRAGKWADIFFAVLDDALPHKDDKKIFIIIDSEGTTRYTDVSRAIADLKKMAKMVEGCCGCDDDDDDEEELDEAPITNTKWRVAFSYDDPSGTGIANARIIVKANDSESAKRFAETDLKKKGSFKNFKIKSASKMNEETKLDEAKFKFNPGKHEIIVSSKRGSDGKFSIEVQDKAIGKKLHSFRHELPGANEDGDKYTDGSRVLAAKRVMNESAELAEATYSFQNKMSGKVRKIKANNDADAIKKMNAIHPVGDDALKSADVSSVDQWFKKYYKIFKEETQLDETPDKYGSAKAKVKASLAAFQKKLDSGKYPDSEADIKKIIARLEAELKKFPGAKNEEVELDEAEKKGVIRTWSITTAPKWKFQLSVNGLKAEEIIEKLSKADFDETFGKATYDNVGFLSKTAVNQAADILVSDYKFVKEDTELEEANLIDLEKTTCKKCGKGKYRGDGDTLTCDKCGADTDRFTREIPTSKTKGGKKILSMLKKEAAGDGTILSWVSKTAKWPFKVEVLGVDGSDLEALIKKASAKSNFERAGNDAVAFKTKNEQQAAIRALEKYYKFVREENIATYDLSVISEEFDESKFRRLATTGLVPEGDVAKAIIAMRNLDAGKELNRNQKDLITGIFHSLIGMVTGDMSVFTKIQQKLKTA